MRDEDDFVVPVTHIHLDDENVDPAVFEKIVAHLVEKFGVERSKIDLDSDLVHQCGMDSLGSMELQDWLEKSFSVDIDEGFTPETVRDLVAAGQGLMTEIVSTSKVHKVPAKWFAPRKPRRFPEGAKTLFEAFMMTAQYQGWDTVAMADENFGVLTYRQTLERIIMFARVMRTYDEEVIGLMLPASTTAPICLMAAMLANKKMSPFNWTIGPLNLSHCIKASEVQRIISSDKFLDKSNAPLTPEIAEMIVPLETVASKQIGISGLVFAKMLARIPWIVPWYFGYAAKPDDEAVILFTSGSDKTPKGVPLTHWNILYNVRGALSAMAKAPEERMVAFLPIFHAFGLSLNGLLALVGGVETYFIADPRRFKHIVHVVEDWVIGFLPATAGLATSILDAAEQLGYERIKSLFAIMTGAQKTPQSLKDRIRKLGIEDIEGYGLTETSPLVTMTRVGEEKIGVGSPIDPETKIMTVDPETMEPLEVGAFGELLISGPGVFKGYCTGEKAKFVTIDDRVYLATGDLGEIVRGNFVPKGRKSRSGKDRNGEMINFNQIEETLGEAYQPLPGASGPRVTLSYGRDRPEEKKEPRIALCTTDRSITIAEANKALDRAGLSRRWYVSHVFYLDEIPMLGGGMKVNYRGLPNPDTVDEGVLEVA